MAGQGSCLGQGRGAAWSNYSSRNQRKRLCFQGLLEERVSLMGAGCAMPSEAAGVCVWHAGASRRYSSSVFQERLCVAQGKMVPGCGQCSVEELLFPRFFTGPPGHSGATPSPRPGAKVPTHVALCQHHLPWPWHRTTQLFYSANHGQKPLLYRRRKLM